MTDLDPIASRANPLLKRARAVRAGREPGVGLLEGRRLIEDAIAAGVELEVLLCDLDEPLGGELAQHPRLRQTVPGLLDGVGELKTSPGLLALARLPELLPLEGFAVNERSLLLAVVGVSDPGNTGALVRAAEAAGADGVAFGPGSASPFSSRALRGSMGSALRVPLFQLESAGQLERLGLQVVAASTRGAEDYRTAAWPRPLCLWIPAETGAASLAPPAGALAVTIPMAGSVESLNVAPAATLLLFEAARR